MLHDNWDYTPLEHIRRMCRIANALVMLRIRGELSCVWLDAEVFHIQRTAFVPRERISWEDAEVLTGLLRIKPQAESVMITGKERMA